MQNKEHKITTVNDILLLSTEELKRFIPGLIKWYAYSKASAEVLGLDPSELNAYIVWTDDGENKITGVNIAFNEGECINLLDESTAPTGKK